MQTKSFQLIFGKIKIFTAKYDIYLIVLAAFAVRLIGYKNMALVNFPEFYRDLSVTYNLAAEHHIPLIGPDSMLGGFYFGPVYYYLMAPFLYLLHYNPYGLILTGVALSSLSVFLLYKLCRLWFNNKNLARLTAVLMAVSIYDIHLAAYVSNPNFLPFFVLAFFYCFTLMLKGDNRIKNAILVGLTFGIATQLHATATLILPLVILIVLIIKRSLPPLRFFIYAFFACLFTYIPYLIYEFQNNFPNARGLMRLGGATLKPNLHPNSVSAIWNFFQGSLTPFNQHYSFSYITPNSLYLVVGALAIIVLGDFLYKFLKKRVGETQISATNDAKLIILCWTVITIVVLLAYRKPAYDHYLIILWPMPIILLAWLVFWLKKKYNVFYSFIFLLLVTSLLQVQSFYQLSGSGWHHEERLAETKKILNLAQNEKFAFQTGSLNVNYYFRLSEAEKHFSKNPDFLYYFTETAPGAYSPNPIAGYKFEKVFTYPNLTVAKYHKQ